MSINLNPKNNRYFAIINGKQIVIDNGDDADLWSLIKDLDDNRWRTINTSDNLWSACRIWHKTFRNSMSLQEYLDVLGEI